jgi:hypothetical protein
MPKQPAVCRDFWRALRRPLRRDRVGPDTEEHAIITFTDYGFGPQSRNRINAAADPSPAGAVAALETFYYALNHCDIEAMAAVWSPHELAQLNNPLGGILRGGAEAVGLYQRIFDSTTRVQVTFGDAVSYRQHTSAVFAGRETGSYTVTGQAPRALEIRTSRFFAYSDAIERWVQLHHHGSIDDPDALRAYQRAVAPE